MSSSPSSGLGAVRSPSMPALLKILAVAQPKRLKDAPQYPTSAEAGLPGYEFVTWFGIVAPKGTPAPMIAKLVKHIHAMQDDPEVQKTLGHRRAGASEGERRSSSAPACAAITTVSATSSRRQS